MPLLRPAFPLGSESVTKCASPLNLMKSAIIFLRLLGILGALYILFGVFDQYGALNRAMENHPVNEAAARFDHLFYYQAVPFVVLAILLLVPYQFLPSGAHRTCAFLLLLVTAYYLFFHFGHYFLPASSPYATPEPLTTRVWIDLFIALAFFLSQLYAIMSQDRRTPRIS